MYAIFEQELKSQGLTNYRVAKLSGVGESVLSDWKRGKSAPNAENMYKLASVLNVSVEYLLGKKEKPRVVDDAELNKIIEDKIREQLKVTVWKDDQAKENSELFSALTPEQKQEALQYLRYLAGVGEFLCDRP